MFKQFILTLSVLLFCNALWAQLPPPISPWMGMFDSSRNSSGIDNYNRVVKPQQDYLKSLNTNAAQFQQMQQAMQSGGMMGMGGDGGRNLGGGLDPNNRSPLAAPREVPSSQSNAAYYNQYLHYYQGGLPRQGVPNFSGGRRR